MLGYMYMYLNQALIFYILHFVLIRDIVRKKAVMALHSLYMKNPSAIPDVGELAKKGVGDNDPGVVSSSLHVFYELIKVCSLLQKLHVHVRYASTGSHVQ